MGAAEVQLPNQKACQLVGKEEVREVKEQYVL